MPPAYRGPIEATTDDPDAAPPGARGGVGARRLVGAAGLGVLVSGLLVNVYLAVVARALPPAEYATFGAFWALALVLGFGAFLPLEQELARRLPRLQDRRALLRAGARTVMVLGVVAVVVLLAVSPVVWRSVDGDVASFLALVALCLVSGGQFLLRGTLIGTDRLVRHAGVMVLDAVLRLGLAVGVFLAGGATSAAFCWALVVAIAVAHLPQLPSAWRRAASSRPPGAVPEEPATTGRLVRAALPLLVGSACAQLLLNGLPVLVVALTTPEDEALVGVFVAAFTLAKAPLSMVVPLQSAVVPTLTRLIAQGRRPEVVVILAKGTAALAGLAAVAVPLAWWLGPPLIRLVFGDDYVIGGVDLALVVAGVLAHVGLVVVTQVHVARGRHGDVAVSWLVGLAAAGLTFWLVPGPVLDAEVAFGVGSLAGAVTSAVILAAPAVRAPRLPAPARGRP